MPRRRTFAARLFIALLSVTFVLVGVHLVLQYMNMVVYNQQNGQIFELSNRFDLDDESSVPTWFSHLLLLLLGASALFTAWLHKPGVTRRLWALVGAAGVLAAIDEIATLHEFILQSLHVAYFQDAMPTALNNAWLIVAPFVLLAFGWLSWRMWQLLPRRTFGLLVGAGIVFLFGAMGIDILTSITDRDTFLHQGLYVAAEESMEQIGCVIALYAIADYIERKHRPALEKVVRVLRAARA